MICPLCLEKQTSLFEKVRNTNYFECTSCSLVFVPRSELISLELEKDRYESHDNSEDNQNYVHYLNEIAKRMIPHIPQGATGLDYGSGKSLILEKILNKAGFIVSSYDVFFYPNKSVFEKTFDFIVLSEVIEHFRDPHEELKKIKSLLKSGGKLFIKTKLLTNQVKDFKNWHYRRDVTHIQFFSEKSFLRLDSLFHFEMEESLGEDLYLFRYNG